MSVELFVVVLNLVHSDGRLPDAAAEEVEKRWAVESCVLTETFVQRVDQRQALGSAESPAHRQLPITVSPSLMKHLR